MSKFVEVTIEMTKVVLVELADDQDNDEALDVVQEELMTGDDYSSSEAKITGKDFTEEGLDAARRFANQVIEL